MRADQWQYLLVMAGCLAVTFPLEFLGAGVYRALARTARAVLPVALIYLLWDAAAISADVWTFNPRYVIGVALAGVPLEEIVFFVVVPLCALLTYQAVEALVSRTRRGRRADVEVHQ